MASARSLTLRLEKANCIAQLELQRANIADSWRETTQPIASLEHTIQGMAKHSWAIGIVAGIAGLAVAAGGNFWLVRKTTKLALFLIPYLVSHRKSGAVGFVWSLCKKLASRWI